MKIIKKLILAVVILLLLVIACIKVLPIIFKDDIVQMVKDAANDNVNATVDFGEFDLSLLSTFPNFLFEIHDITVIGVDTFATDTLVKLGRLSLKVNLESVMDGDYVVESIAVSDLYAHAIILEDSTENWDITVSDSSIVEEEVVALEEVDSLKSDAPFKFELSNFSFSNINVIYDHRLSDMKAEIVNLNLEGDYKMNGEQMTLNTMTNIDAVTLIMDGVKLMNRVEIMAKADLDIDNKNSKYTFKENEFALNDLKLAIDGWLAMPGDDMDFDLNIAAKNNTFSEVLSLIPSVYKSDIAAIDTKGDFSLTASLKGLMTEDKLPAFNVGFSIKNGFLKYPDLPESVKNIQVELKVDNKTGVIDHTVVNLELFHFEIADNPIDIKFYVRNVESDPDMIGNVKSKLNFENLAKALPMEEGEEYKGRLNADIEFAGKLSSIENEQYEDFDLKGQLTLMDLVYRSPDLPNVNVKNMHINFTPQFFELGNLDLTIGKSDLNGKGKIDNILPYVFNDDTIQGSFSLNSNYFNLDELMSEDSTVTSSETEATASVEGAAVSSDSSSATGVVEVPGNIDFILNTNFKKIDYDNMPITNFEGKLIVKNSQVKFSEASLNILGGSITLDGTYSTQNPKTPTIDMDLSIKNMDIPVAFSTFNTVEKMAPIARHAKGSFSTALNLKGAMTSNMELDFNSLTGTGDLMTKDLVIEGHPLFDKLAKVLKNPKYKKVKANDLTIKYEFRDGKVHVEPFELKIGNTTAQVHGWNSFEQTLEYTFEFEIPREEFGGEANALLSSLESQASQFGAKIALGEYVLVDVIASGPVSDPALKLVPKGMSGEEGKSMKEQASDAVKEVVKEKVDELKNKAKEESDRLKREAEDKARAEGDRLKKEAEAKAQAEVDKQKAVLKAKADAEKKKQEQALKNEAKKLLKGW
ncbi:MAG: hypothetical protein ACJA0Q_001061 [Saprospiraceae bacterium]|jgi:uncharacterized protein involved in outer membrane biogenesis